MDLVDEEQRLTAIGAAQLRRLEHFFQVGDAGKHRRYLLEGKMGFTGQQPRHRRLAGAGRAPEDHRAERAGNDQPRQRTVGAGEMLLANDLSKVFRAQPVGERPAGRRFFRFIGTEQVSHACLRVGARPLGPGSVAQHLAQCLPATLDGKAPPARVLLSNLCQCGRRLDGRAIHLAHDIARLEAEIGGG